MNIVLIGPQGSGKGTQAKRIEKKYGYKHISTGEIYRRKVREGDKLALRMKEYVDKGGLIPDEIVVDMIKGLLSDKGNILDGIPRTIKQAELLDKLIKIDLAIELKLSDEIAVKRISSRRECAKCGAVYGYSNPPKKPSICDICQGPLEQREDDKPDAVLKRLATYREKTEPIVEYYKSRGIAKSVDASKDIESVFKDICKIIDSQKTA
ncbi:nucleoside monophosphate kinase [Candidatus Woesearchaeota archaeon]|nr:MAG: nucleoside monophosphate kinase [Candidatus Woesearchaeota archaeon]